MFNMLLASFNEFVSEMDILPPSGVNFIAFVNMFMRICRKRSGSAMTYGYSIGWFSTMNLKSLFTRRPFINVVHSSCVFSMLIVIMLMTCVPLSIFVMSRTSFTRAVRCFVAFDIFSRQSSTLLVSFMFSFAICVMPTMLLSGVRMSCDMCDRNLLFAQFAERASCVARTFASLCIDMYIMSIESALAGDINDSVLLKNCMIRTASGVNMNRSIA